VSNKKTNRPYAKKHHDFRPDTQGLGLWCLSFKAILLIAILIIGNGFVLKAQTRPGIGTNAATPADSSTGMVSPALDKEEHPVEKPKSKDTTPFDEAMVMAYTAKKKINNEADARPQPGWDSFEKYIQDKAVASAGKTGAVQLSFIVNANGKLSDFKIIENLDDADNKAAIDMIKNGPAWMPAPGGIAKEVTVKVDFH
jgi:TonB family protein